MTQARPFSSASQCPPTLQALSCLALSVTCVVVVCVAACTCARVSGASRSSCFLVFVFFDSSYPMQACPVACVSVCPCVCVRLCSTWVCVISNDAAMLIQYKTWLATNARIASCHAYLLITMSPARLSAWRYCVGRPLQLLAPRSRTLHNCPRPS
ncbi:hypothetical protein F5X97DRAFT_141300 [Nemania serpens]|nr:hypothetical protein F5X97DRAFT_141300 [Nemania serpens]